MRALPDFRLSDVLAVGSIQVGFRSPDTEQAVNRLLRPALEAGGLASASVEAALQAVCTRERSCSTVIGALALPHARVIGLAHIVGSLGLNSEGVYEAEGTIRAVLAFVSPASDSVGHLRFLARIAELIRLPKFLDELQASKSSESALALIRSLEREH